MPQSLYFSTGQSGSVVGLIMYVSHLLCVHTSCDIMSQVKQVMEEISDKIPESFNITEIMAKVEERTPYIIVAFQECERMNFLMAELKRSLKELELGLRVNIMLTFVLL